MLFIETVMHEDTSPSPEEDQDRDWRRFKRRRSPPKRTKGRYLAEYYRDNWLHSADLEEYIPGLRGDYLFVSEADVFDLTDVREETSLIDTHTDEEGSFTSGAMYNRGGGARPKVLLVKPDVLNSGLQVDTPMKTSSRLSKTFREIMQDSGAIQCLLQYLTNRQRWQLLQFWLDAQSFQAATWSRLQTQNYSSHAERLDSGSDPECVTSGSVDMDGEAVQSVKGQSSQEESTNVQYQAECDSHNTMVAAGPLVPPGGNTCTGDRSPQITANTDTIQNKPKGADLASHSSQQSGDITSKNSPHSSDDSVKSSPKSPSSPAEHLRNSTLPQHSTRALGNHGDLALAGQAHSGIQSSNHGDSVSPTGVVSMATADSASLGSSSVGTGTPAKKEHFLEKLKKSIERDAVKIYSKYISKDATHPIAITDKLRDATISRICREDGQVDPQCFVPCQEFVLDVIEKEHYKDFMLSEFHCKHQVDVLTSTEVILADVLYNESAIVYFMEFMEQEKAMSLLQCWLELDSFQQHLDSQQGQYDSQQAQNDAMVIYEKYFSLQATQPLGFDDNVRFEVEGNICREEGPLPDCFSKPKLIVLTTIDKMYFQQYLKNDLYFKYLSDLISTVQTAQDLPPVRRKRTGSDASSEKSFGSHSTGSENIGISSKNTLLATDTSSFHIKKAIHKINDDMRIDGALFNPDSLWQREQAGKMSLGKVNDLGQFISEFDPEPDQDRRKKGGTFFKRKKEKEKAQEQMAIQIAQMIISDITSTTSTEPNSHLVNEEGTTSST